MADNPVPEPKYSILQGSSAGAESDLGDLAALFSAHGGGNFSPEASAQLALEIVLNEIVEQACLATGATGAAIVLVRGGEMVCRASSGANAPVLGSPLDSESGLTAECIRTHQVQRCDDAQADPRADAGASRRLGVRSVMILPLLRKGELEGVLEVFSSRPGAFGDRDELTLEALAQRILGNLERASQPLSLASKAASSSSEAAGGDAEQNPPAARVTPVVPITQGVPEDLRAGSAKSVWEEADVLREMAGRRTRAGFDGVSVALGAAVVVCAVLLGTLVGVRMGWRRAAAMHGQVAKSTSGAGLSEQRSAEKMADRNGAGQNGVVQNQAAANQAAQNQAAQNQAAQNGVAQAGGEAGTNAGSAPGARNAGSEKRNASAAGTSAVRAKDSFPPAGSLVVYENGKEIFRQPPTVEGEGAQSAVPGAVPGEVQQASAVEPAGTGEVAPDVAEGSLLYRVEPEYPEDALQQRIEGAVVLEVRIGRDGAIQDVNLVSGQASLANAAIAAVKQWRFKPRMRNGQSVEMQTRVTLNFKMPG